MKVLIVSSSPREEGNSDPQREAAEGTLAAFCGFIRCLPDAQEKGVIYGMGAWDKGDVYRHPSYGCMGEAPPVMLSVLLPDLRGL